MKLVDICEFIRPQSFNKDNYSTEKTDVGLITSINFDNGDIELNYDNIKYLKNISVKNNLKENDIIISLNSGSIKTLGKICLVTNLDKSINYVTTSFNIILRSKMFEYVFYYLLYSERYKEMLKYNPEKQIQNLSINSLKDFEINLSLQTEIDKIISLNKEIKLKQKELYEYTRNFKTM